MTIQTGPRRAWAVALFLLLWTAALGNALAVDNAQPEQSRPPLPPPPPSNRKPLIRKEWYAFFQTLSFLPFIYPIQSYPIAPLY